MFGFTGINAAAAFKILVCLICLISGCTAYAGQIVFQSRDVFLKPDLCKHCVRGSESAIGPKEFAISNEKKILVFVDPQCAWCKKALQDLGNLKKRNPRLGIQVYMMATIKEFMEYFYAYASSLPSGLDYTLDFKNILANQYEVNQTPTYIIMDQGKSKKVEGYVDLRRFDLADHN